MFFNSKETITSFDTITLRISGMRFVEEYEIVSKDNKAELSRYNILFRHGEDNRELNKRVTVDIDTVLDLLNQCKIMKWDNFSGANPRGVLDGYMFTFKAIVNDGKKIHAKGSNNYPRHYHEFRDTLTELLNDNQ